VGGDESPAPVRVANHRRVHAALALLLGFSPDKLAAARRALEAHHERQVVVALVTSGSKSVGQMAGIYTVSASPDATGGAGQAAPALAVRVFGTGPSVITAAMVSTLFKFDTATREFREVGVGSGAGSGAGGDGVSPAYGLPATADAVGIEPSWVSVARRDDGKGAAAGTGAR
jgi:hypothetical protein